MELDCELNKPLCKRKLSMMEGPFQKPKRCPLSEKAGPSCPLAPPRCPLLPAEEGNECPVNTVIGNKNTKLCPLAQPACPCDPTPPCPLSYQQVNRDKQPVKSNQVTCPSKFPTYGTCSDAIGKADVTAKKSPCSNARSVKFENNKTKNLLTVNNSQTQNKHEKTKNKSNKKHDKTLNRNKRSKRILKKKNLTVPDCTLSSRRPLPCSDCLGDLLANTEKSLNEKDCPYLKLIDYCEDTCLCDELASIDTGPTCPFAPKPCPCCAVPRCPLTRQTDCPILSKRDAKTRKPLSCKCYCPVIPPPCSLNIPIGCRMHHSDNPPPCSTKPAGCKCDSESKKCPLVPSLYTTCPLQPNYQNVPCSEYKPESTPIPPKQPQLPSVLVTPNVLNSIDSILGELNKMCTCDTPPPPQMVNMISTSSVPSPSNQPQSCIATEVHDKCPIDCSCEPPRTFHVPTCPKKNPACLISPPKSNEKGAMVCPFYPRCCPLGSVCPFPVPAAANRPKEAKKYIESSPIKNEKNVPLTLISGNNYQKGLLETSKEEETQKNNIAVNNEIPVSNCPLSNMAGGRKKKCPFAPAPCPLDPVKPLSIKEPKICPHAPEPLCPLMPKPICPPMPNCLMKSSAPLPECPYAPPGCPLAPKKVCFPDSPMNYDCPCPKPKKCSCPDPGLNCPCPEADPSCPCPPVTEKSLDSSCPCPNPNSGCPCPNPIPGCPCPNPDSTCPCPPPSLACPLANPPSNCPCPDPNQNCPCPSPIQCLLVSKPKCPLAPKVDPNCPLNIEKPQNADEKTVSFAKRDNNFTLPPNITGCPCPTQNSTGFPCPSQDGNNCGCPSQDGAKCPCPMLTNKCSCCPCEQPKACVVNTVVETLMSKPKDLDCAVKTPACEKFPEGRCAMEDLGLCNCDYPCPPCMEPAQCGTAQAPSQYCLKQDCCMGLSLPPVIPDDRKFMDYHKLDDPITYYQFVPTKPGREETKYHVNLLDHPPNEFPFGKPQERRNPNWYIVRYGKAFEKCDKVAEKLKNRKPNADAESQFDPNDNPMEPEMKALLESIQFQDRLDKEERFEL